MIKLKGNAVKHEDHNGRGQGRVGEVAILAKELVEVRGKLAIVGDVHESLRFEELVIARELARAMVREPCIDFSPVTCVSALDAFRSEVNEKIGFNSQHFHDELVEGDIGST
jgi:hypothetical protein